MQKKRILITFFLIFFLGIVWDSYIPVFADDECPAECKIKDGTPDFLLEYINTVKKITTNVKSEIAKSWVGTTSKANVSYGRIQKDLMRTFNLFGDWSGYYSSFEYFVQLPLTQSVPAVVKRDEQLLENQVQTLTKTIENLSSRWQLDVAIEKPCDGVDDVCKLESATSREIIGNLLMNTKKILELYQLSILGKDGDYNEQIILVKDDFRSQFSQYYNASTAEDCSRCKGSFTEKIETSIDQVTNWGKWSKNGIQRWIDAWNMLIGNVDATKQRDYERQVLSKELSRQWLNTNNSSVILNNLDKYNNQWFYSIDNNFIENSFSTATQNLGKKVDSFSETILQKFEETGEQRVEQQVLTQTDTDVKNTQSIQSKVDSVYQNEIPFASIEDTSSDLLQTRLINYHINLTEIINELDKTIPTSEKVCNDQANGLGRCSY